MAFKARKRSTFTVAYNGIGVVSGILVQRFGPKIVGITSSVIVGVSIRVSYFAKTVAHLLICQSIILAIATCSFSISCSAVVGNWFSGKGQLMALAIVSCGCGIAGMLYSYILEFLSENYGLAGTYLISGAITLNGLACTLSWPSEQRCIGAKSTAAPTVEHKAAQTIPMTLKCGLKQLLSGKTFMLFAFGVSFTVVPLYTSLIFLADLLADRQNEHFASLAIFLFNLFSIFGRLLPGILNQVPHCSALVVPLFATVSGVGGCLLLALVDTAVLNLIAGVMNGVSFGTIMSSVAVTSVQTVGKEHIATAIGIIYTISGIAILSAGPINGYIRDTTGNYTGVYLYAALLLCVGGIFFLAANCTRTHTTSTH